MPNNSYPRTLPKVGGWTALQRDLVGALGQANRQRKIGVRQSWRLKDALRRQLLPAATLERLLDEMIDAGASDDDVLAVVSVLECDVRQKLAVRRGDKAPDLLAAHVAETVAESEANIAQIGACTEKSPSAIRRLLDRVARHRAALESLALSARAELARVESPSHGWGVR